MKKDFLDKTLTAHYARNFHDAVCGQMSRMDNSAKRTMRGENQHVISLSPPPGNKTCGSAGPPSSGCVPCAQWRALVMSHLPPSLFPRDLGDGEGKLFFFQTSSPL